MLRALEGWAYFFKHAEELGEAEIERLRALYEILGMACGELNMYNWSPADRLAWEQRLIAEQDAYEVELVKKEEAIAEGLERGLQQGLERGRLQGREEGWQGGRQEAVLEMAKNLLTTGMQLEQIARIAGLDVETLNSLMFGQTVSAQGASSKKSASGIQPSTQVRSASQLQGKKDA
jgi:predicted transposase/invertase (TIGR01784 family)